MPHDAATPLPATSQPATAPVPAPALAPGQAVPDAPNPTTSRDSNSHTGPLRRYRRIFAVRGSAAFFVAGWIGRIPRSTLSLGSELLIAGATGRYTLAAAVAAAIVIGVAVFGPLWSRGMDRLGQRRILIVTVSVSTLAGLALLAVVLAGAPQWTWFVAAFLVGATSVDIGSATRARWSSLLPAGEARHTALSLESVADESVFVIGPPLVTVLAAAVNPVLGFGVGLLLGVVGGAALVLQRRTTPVVQREPAAAAFAEPAAGSAAAAHPEPPAAAYREPAAPPRRRRMLRPLPRGVLALLPVFLGVGVVFGSLDLTAVGVSEAEGAPAAAGFLLAMFALGSVVSGLVFGARGTRIRPAVMVAASALAYGIVVSLAVFVPTLPALGAALLVAGGATTPLLISAMALVESRVERERLTEGLAWPSTAMSIGVTAGSALAGILIDASAARAGFLITAAGASAVGVAGLVGIIALLVRRRRSQAVISLAQGD
ncbi:MFS transporter [Herbiconiux sp. YIM B11900]|uniref:MFS transporter n=1 Tax=Herbiconiux sp. YIM B11900 TaxID=3404131 RepID=UPI003F8291A8